MKFTLTYRFGSETRNEAIARFKTTGGRTPKGAQLPIVLDPLRDEAFSQQIASYPCAPDEHKCRQHTCGGTALLGVCIRYGNAHNPHQFTPGSMETWLPKPPGT
jgi:hypothetical protein